MYNDESLNNSWITVKLFLFQPQNGGNDKKSLKLVTVRSF